MLADPTCLEKKLLLLLLGNNLPHGVMVVNSEMMNWLASGNDKSFRIGKQNLRPTKARE